MTIEVFGENTQECERAADEAIKEVKTIDRLMSVFDRKSELSRMNQNAGRSEVHVDKRLIEILQSSLFYNRLTDGVLDVTIEPLMEAWGFRGDEKSSKPTDSELQAAVNAVGSKVISIDTKGSAAGVLHEGSKLDLGGIAVGYSVDRAVEILRRHGVECALVNHSGDIYALGSPPGEDGWLIGITDPEHTDEVITSLRVRDKAVSTSGNYENFVSFDGLSYGHIMNPRTGEPASDILSTTIISETALEADALSTGVFVMGLQKGLKLVESMKSPDLIAVVRKEGQEEVISTLG